MRVLESDFLLVGMTENISEYMEALGLLLPHFFEGAKDVFENKGMEFMKLFTKNHSHTPSSEGDLPCQL